MTVMLEQCWEIALQLKRLACSLSMASSQPSSAQTVLIDQTTHVDHEPATALAHGQRWDDKAACRPCSPSSQAFKQL